MARTERGCKEEECFQGKQGGTQGELQEQRKGAWPQGMEELEVLGKTASTGPRSYSSPNLSSAGSPAGSEVF